MMGANTDKSATGRKTTHEKKPRASHQKLSLHGLPLEEAQAGLLAAGPTPDKAAQKAERAKTRAKQAQETAKPASDTEKHKQSDA